MDIEKSQKVVREIVTNVEEEEESVVEERNKLEKAVMTRLASPCLQQLEAALQENRSLHARPPHKLLMSFRKIADSICCVHVYLLFYSCLCVYPHDGRFKREVWEYIQVQLAQIALFRYSPNLPQSHYQSSSPCVCGSLLLTYPLELYSRVSLHPSAIFPRSSCWTCSRGKYPYCCVKIHCHVHAYVHGFYLCSQKVSP